MQKWEGDWRQSWRLRRFAAGECTHVSIARMILYIGGRRYHRRCIRALGVARMSGVA